MSHYSWPVNWNTLRSQGRLQLSRSPVTRQWRIAIPELGVEIRAREMGELTEKVAPYLRKLPTAHVPLRVNGHDHVPLPPHRNLLPRR
jgi:hypothetical protein